MDVQRFQLKIYAQPGYVLDSHRSVRVFHRWIKEHVLSEQLVDVADYSHVHHGPQVALIGHGSDYYLDDGEGRLGLLYFRKRAAPPPHERLKDAFRRCLTAAQRLEREPGFDLPPRFSTQELLLRFVDRLQAPNTEQGYAPLREPLEQFLAGLYGAPVSLVREGSERELLGVRIQLASAPPLDELVERLGGAAAQPKKRLLKIG